jgi:hypothetical protein
MEKLDKIKLAIEKGVTCNPKTGVVYGVKGNIVNNINKGYNIISLYNNKKVYRLMAHQFVYYWVNNEIVDIIDHINGNKSDNRIVNLRSVNHSTNLLNVKSSKGFYYHKLAKKWAAQIQIDNNFKYLGLYNTPEEASKAYTTEKQKYIL